MIKELHIISTGKQSTKTLAAIAAEIHPFIDFIHLREKSWTDKEMAEAIELLISNEVPRSKIIVNNRIDVAHVMKTQGVQLTHQSIPITKVKHFYNHLRVGCSVHSADEVIYAANHGADYLVYGHIFKTNSKPGLEPKGLKGLQEITEKAAVPVIAIGGITPENTQDVINSGANGIAVLSGVLLASDPLETVKKYRQALMKAREDCEAAL